jgi:hypothetical protein
MIRMTFKGKEYICNGEAGVKLQLATLVNEETPGLSVETCLWEASNYLASGEAKCFFDGSRETFRMHI